MEPPRMLALVVAKEAALDAIDALSSPIFLVPKGSEGASPRRRKVDTLAPT